MAEERILNLKLLGTKESEATLQKLQRTVDVLRKRRTALNKQEKSGVITSKEASRQRLRLNTQLKVASTNLNRLTREQLISNGAIKKSAGLTQSLTKGFATIALRIGGITAALAILKNSFNIIKDFQQSQADLASVLGKTRSEITELTEDAKQLGATTAFTATEVGKLQKEFAKLGFTQKEIRNATKATLELAAATGSDLARAAEVVGSTIRAFGLDASETQRVVDVMAKSFSSSALDMEKFATAMGNVAPVAKNAGLEIEETTSLLGVLVDRGIDASTAGTGLRNIFLELSKQGLTFNEAMEKINNATDKNAVALELFGKRGATVASILAENGDQAKLLETRLIASAGAAERMANEQLNTLQGKLTILNSAWEGFILSLDDGDGVISDLVGSLAVMGTEILGLLSGTESLTDEFNKQVKLVQSLEKNMVPLIDRYDELTEQTELSVAEQEELDIIINQLAQDIPSAVTEFDKYGKALSISTTAARAFAEQQKEILKIKNAEAIEEQKDEVQSLRFAYESLTRGLDRVDGVLVRNNVTFTKTGNLLQTTTELGDAEIAMIQRRKGEIQTEIDARNAIIASLQGQKSAVEENADAEAEAAAEAERLAKEAADREKGLTEKEIKELEKRRKAHEKEQARITELQLKNAQIRLQIASAESEEELEKIADEFDAIQDDSEERLSLLFSDSINRAALRLLEATTIKEEEDAKLQAEDARFQTELNTLGDQQSAIELATLRHEQNKEAIEKSSIRKRLSQAADFFDRASGFLNSLTTIFEANKQRELSAAGENAFAREQIEKKFAKKQKKLRLTSALINAAGGITRAFVDYQYPASLVIAALVAFQTGAEIAAINSAKFEAGGIAERGGVLKGKSHKNGGIPFTVGGRAGFEAQGGEPILTKGVGDNPRLRAAASALNVAGGGVAFDLGGMTPQRFQQGAIPSPIFTPSNIVGSEQNVFDMELLASRLGEELSERINDLKVKNVVTETREGVQNVESVESEASFG